MFRNIYTSNYKFVTVTDIKMHVFHINSNGTISTEKNYMCQRVDSLFSTNEKSKLTERYRV